MSDDVEVHRALGRIEGKLDGMLGRMTAQENRHADHESRIRAIEAGQNKQLGWAAAMGSVASIIITLAVKFLPNPFS